MGEKKLPRAKLERAINLVKAVYGGTDWEAAQSKLSDMVNACCNLGSEVGIGAYVLVDFAASICRYNGLNPDATNEDIYKVLEALGWEVE